MIDPGGVDHQQRFQKIGGPLLGVHLVTVILIFRSPADGYYWVAPAGLSAVPPSSAYEEIFKSSHFFENELVSVQQIDFSFLYPIIYINFQ